MLDKKEYFTEVFSKLQDSIGKTVSCIFWEYGKLSGFRDKLTSVVPFDYIKLGEGPNAQIVSFVGERTAIQYIIVQEQGVVYSIYQNPNVENYRGSFRDPMQVIESQKEFLGYSIKEEELQNRTSTR